MPHVFWGGVTHVPVAASHTWPLGHVMPAAPHAAMHAPFTHVEPGGQVWPAAPHAGGGGLPGTHAPRFGSHTWPVGHWAPVAEPHDARHAPFTHTRPCGQLALLLHCGGVVGTHTPRAGSHTSPGAHVAPFAPQVPTH